jgi:CRISPR type III-B/RAMP module-associated protein Cmr5
MMMHTRSQLYAAEALARIDAIKGNATLRDEYKSRADSFSVMVMQAGLAQGLGFLLAKSKTQTDNGYGRYLQDLAAVLKAGKATPANTGEQLQQSAITATLADYRLLTRETLAAAGWLKRFAQAYIKKEDKKDSGGQS